MFYIINFVRWPFFVTFTNALLYFLYFVVAKCSNIVNVNTKLNCHLNFGGCLFIVFSNSDKGNWRTFSMKLVSLSPVTIPALFIAC